MDRYLQNVINNDLANKIVLLTSPRQTGKTTLSKQLGLSYDYLNMDNDDHMLAARKNIGIEIRNC